MVANTLDKRAGKAHNAVIHHTREREMTSEFDLIDLAEEAVLAALVERPELSWDDAMIEAFLVVDDGRLAEIAVFNAINDDADQRFS